MSPNEMHHENLIYSSFKTALYRISYTVTLYLRDITINSVERVGNYLDQNETMLCTNNYTLKQIDTLCPFYLNSNIS